MRICSKEWTRLTNKVKIHQQTISVSLFPKCLRCYLILFIVKNRMKSEMSSNIRNSETHYVQKSNKYELKQLKKAIGELYLSIK